MNFFHWYNDEREKLKTLCFPLLGIYPQLGKMSKLFFHEVLGINETFEVIILNIDFVFSCIQNYQNTSDK